MLIHNLPPNSATAHAIAGTPRGWEVDSFLIADLYAAWAGEPHPSRPKGRSRAATLHERLIEQRKRKAKRLESE